MNEDVDDEEIIDEQCSDFCFRGAGLASIVIGFERAGKHFVWRFRTVKNETDLRQVLANYNYLNEVIRPLLDPDFTGLIAVRTLKILSRNMVKKICLINDEIKARLGDVLFNITCPVPVVEMPDFTKEKLLMSLSQNYFLNDVITVELKPKQGHVTELEPFKPYCTNCLLQYVKSTVGHIYQNMYEFCPLNLYSGKLDEIRKALRSLLRVPHNNFRLFKNGDLIFSQRNFVDETTLAKLLNFTNIDEFLELLIKILLHSTNSDCILIKLLKVQKLDTCGPVKAAELSAKFPNSVEINSHNQRYRIFDPDNVVLSADEQLLRNCLIAATIKDCSIMISLCKVNGGCSDYSVCTDNVQFMDTEFGTFAFKINLIDFDAKTPAKLISYNNKLQAARKMIKENVRKGCY